MILVGPAWSRSIALRSSGSAAPPQQQQPPQRPLLCCRSPLQDVKHAAPFRQTRSLVFGETRSAPRLIDALGMIFWHNNLDAGFLRWLLIPTLFSAAQTPTQADCQTFLFHRQFRLRYLTSHNLPLRCALMCWQACVQFTCAPELPAPSRRHFAMTQLESRAMLQTRTQTLEFANPGRRAQSFVS